MEYRLLGRTGLRVSAIGFGAGPVAALMTDPQAADRQREIVQAALDVGINWFDTAPGYGEGASERQLGRTLSDLGALDRVHVATKVRLQPGDRQDIPGAVRRSVEESLRRLGRDRVELLQLHNAVTEAAGTIHLSLTPREARAAGEAMALAQGEGLVGHVGMTGQGEPEALREVLQSGLFATAQVSWNLLEVMRRAGRLRRAQPHESACPTDALPEPADYAEANVAVIAIRVLAGGALALQPPSAHTRRTPYFPLAQYEADLREAEELQRRLPQGLDLAEAALRTVLHEPAVTLALIGFADAGQVRQAVRCLDRPPDRDLARRLGTPSAG
jgi:aryl-alcohol dehydrogenase-like predicted oxidoreductase